jgi:hypothetical protein
MVRMPGWRKARMLLGLLQEEITEISRELEALGKRARRPHLHGEVHREIRERSLRRQLYEAHRLIDGLYRRFPDTLDRSQSRTAVARNARYPPSADSLPSTTIKAVSFAPLPGCRRTP